MKGIIFDFDGTIADTSYIWEKVDRDFFAVRGMSVPEGYVDKIATMSFIEGAIYTKNTYNIIESVESIMNEWSSHALFEYSNNAKLKNGAKKYIELKKRQGFKIGLATASNPEFYRPMLEREGVLGYFDAFADGTDDVRGKDFPDIYLLCAERLGLKPDECTVYEDVYKGLMSAKKCGMKTVAVYDEYVKYYWEALKKEADSYIIDFYGE